MVSVLIEAARGADLFIAECYTFDRPVPFHTSWMSLREHLQEIGAKRVLLTHMSTDMLEQVAIDGAERRRRHGPGDLTPVDRALVHDPGGAHGRMENGL